MEKKKLVPPAAPKPVTAAEGTPRRSDCAATKEPNVADELPEREGLYGESVCGGPRCQ